MPSRGVKESSLSEFPLFGLGLFKFYSSFPCLGRSFSPSFSACFLVVKLACCICCLGFSFRKTLPLLTTIHGGINSLNKSSHLFDPLLIDLGDNSIWVIHHLFLLLI
jgi:hypothetical protein